MIRTVKIGRPPLHGGCAGGSLSPLYKRWSGMIGRCHKPKNNKFHRYGADGITVCDEWRKSFSAFELWSSENGFDPSLQIDRIDNNKGYSPENCRWVTPIVNQANRRSSIIFPSGETTAQVAARLGMSPNGIRGRLAAGMPIELAMMLPFTPNGGKRKWFRKSKLNLWDDTK